MKRKQALIILSGLFVGTLLYGVVLPDGTNLPDNQIEEIKNYPNGSVYEIEFRTPQLLTTPAGQIRLEEVTFYENGKIKECDISGTQIISTSVGPIRAEEVTFYENGKIKKCDIAGSIAIQTSAGQIQVDEILFYENGKVKRCDIRGVHSVSLPGIGQIALEEIAFYENGKIKGGELKSSQIIQGTSFYDDDHILISEDGKSVKRAWWDDAKEDYVAAENYNISTVN